MPQTYRALYGLNPWDGIRNYESLPYLYRRRMSSMIWRENGEKPKPYAAEPCKSDFLKAYKVMGSELVRLRHIRNPRQVGGKIELTPEGEAAERQLQKPKNVEGIERLRRSRQAMSWLSGVVKRLQEDLTNGVIKEQ